MFSINSLYAQKDSLNVSTNNESYKRVYILDVGLGIGFTGIQEIIKMMFLLFLQYN